MTTIKKNDVFELLNLLKVFFPSKFRLNNWAVYNLNLVRVRSYFNVLIFSIVCLFSSVLLAEEIPCNVCHSKVDQQHQLTPHGKADIDCKSCHGDGEQHIAAPSSTNISSFSLQSNKSDEQYSVCSNCHNNTHSTQTNAHSAAGLTCGSCHSLHSEVDDNKQSNLPLDLKHLTAGSSLCFDCHQDSFTQFKFNERHRLEEGVIACSSCHDPHNPKVGMELGGFKQSVCSDCHADLEGPFIHEHAASRVEGCAACHEPHGSPNRHMLKIQEVGALCYSCHADAPQFHIGFSPSAPPIFDETTVCTNCHVAVHGSNLDSKLLR